MIADSTRNKTPQKPLGLHYNKIPIAAPCNDSAFTAKKTRKSQFPESSWESRAKRPDRQRVAANPQGLQPFHLTW
jgi:hypothetical protein